MCGNDFMNRGVGFSQFLGGLLDRPVLLLSSDDEVFGRRTYRWPTQALALVLRASESSLDVVADGVGLETINRHIMLSLPNRESFK